MVAGSYAKSVRLDLLVKYSAHPLGPMCYFRANPAHKSRTLEKICSPGVTSHYLKHSKAPRKATAEQHIPKMGPTRNSKVGQPQPQSKSDAQTHDTKEKMFPGRRSNTRKRSNTSNGLAWFMK